MVQARLRTRRLLLVPLAEDHLEHEIDLDSDPEVMRYLGNGKPATREQVVQAPPGAAGGRRPRTRAGVLGRLPWTGVRGLVVPPATCAA
jgi:hypothetical protein